MASAAVPGDATLALRPQLVLDVPGSMVSLQGAAHLNYNEYLGVIDPATNRLRQLDGDLGLDIEVNRGGFLGFAVGDHFVRAVDPGVASLGARLARFRNDATAAIELRPGGGMLTFGLHYKFGLEMYDPRDPNYDPDNPTFLAMLGLYEQNNQFPNPEYFNNMQHQLKLKTEWRFLPKTGLFLNIHASAFNYLDPNSPNVAAYPVGIEFGGMGAITGKLSGLIKLGYNNPMIFSSDLNNQPKMESADYIGVNGQFEMRYAITEINSVAGGFTRSMSPVFVYRYYTDNRFYLRTTHLFFDRLELSGNAHFSLIEFGDPIAIGSAGTGIRGGGDRLDQDIGVRVGLKYNILDWLSVGVSNGLAVRLSNAYDTRKNLDFSFMKNLTLLTLTAMY